jgi:hypothetical protein
VFDACRNLRSGSCRRELQVHNTGQRRRLNAGAQSASASVTIKVDKTAPTLACAQSPKANSNGWNNTDVTVTFTAADALSGLASVSPAVTLKSEGAHQAVNGTATDIAGTTSDVVCSLSIDKTPPEAFSQFDVASGDLKVFGKDGLSGVAAGVVAPSSVPVTNGDHIGQHEDSAPGTGGSTQRTYRIADLAGNTLVLVMRVSRRERSLTGQVISLQYNGAAAITAVTNHERFEWETEGGKLEELQQTIQIGAGNSRQKTTAKFESESNKTTIQVSGSRPGSTESKPGLILLRTTTNGGKLVVEF